MSIPSIYNNNFDNFKSAFITEETNQVSYSPKNVISNNSCDFISFEINFQMSNINVTELKKELSKLDSELKAMETQVRDLEKMKIMKVTKVDDLRKIIVRIADENSFRRNLVHRQQRVKAKNINVKKINNSFENELINTISFSTCCETEEEMEGDDKEGICNSDDGRSYYPSNNHFNQCLLFWQTYLPQPLMY